MDIIPTFRIPSSSRLSTLKGLLRNTFTAADRSVVNQFLLDGEKELQGFQVEISRLQTAILALEARKEGLKKMMEKYRSLLSPIHRMPLDVLTNIFEFCCDANFLEPDSPPPAMTLSFVCGKWRELALNTPSLWASLTIYYYHWEGCEFEPLIQLTQLFVERSKTFPLTLDLDFFSSDLDSHEEDCDAKPVLDILVQHSSRWYDIRWCFRREQMDHPTFEPLRGHLPMLQYLDISATDEGNPVNEDDTWNLFRDCPRLHTVNLSTGFPLSDTILLPWQQITVLTVGGNPVRILRVLSQCPNLRQLDFWIGSKLSMTHLYDVQSPELLSLSIQASNAKDLSFLLPLMAPQLSCIEIQGGYSARYSRDFDQWDELKPFTGFLIRSSCSITSLHLQWLPIIDTQTTSLLDLMPTLRVLSIRECTQAVPAKNRIITSSFLNRLTVDHVGLDTVFLLRLTELEFCVVGEDLDQRALLQMLSSRWLPDLQSVHRADVDCLQSFSLTVVGKEEDPSPECFAMLQHFSNSGLRVTTIHTHEDT